jgi:hypothetical protein
MHASDRSHQYRVRRRATRTSSPSARCSTQSRPASDGGRRGRGELEPAVFISIPMSWIQLAGTVTTGGAERTPTSEIEKSNITPVNMDFERISSSAIQNQRPLYWMET